MRDPVVKAPRCWCGARATGQVNNGPLGRYCHEHRPEFVRRFQWAALAALQRGAAKRKAQAAGAKR